MHYYNSMSGEVYDNRYDAIDAKYNRQQDVLFYYRDNEYEKIDWKVEPTESLHQLYKERAQQIRDSYDYVTLCYSGGIDSTNVLETFYYNNIHIDEIVSVGSFSQDVNRDIDFNHNKDIYDNVMSNLARFNLPNTKKTFIDYTEYFNDLSNFSLYQDYNAEYYKYIGVYPSVTYLFWYDLPKFLNSKKNSTIIYGIEKPFIQIDNTGRFFFEHSDLSMRSYSNYKTGGSCRSNFYSDPEAEKIIRKQMHIIKNHFIEKVVVKEEMSERHFFHHTNYSDIIHKLIYDIKNPLQYVSTKGTNVFLSQRDNYIKSKTNSEIFRLYAHAMQHMVKNYGLTLNNRYEILSKRYYLT